MLRWVQRGSVVALLVSLAGCKCGQMPPTMNTLKEEHEACAGDEECKSGLCEAVPGFQTVCMRKCTEGCKADEVCEQLTTGRFSCNPDRGGLCRACALDTDCPFPGDKCIVVDNKGICGRDCAFDQNCPTSYRCLNGLGIDGKPKSQQCSPVSGSCSCTAASAGQMISCETTNSIGTCQGNQTCDGVMGYTACSARTPSLERCNGIDDDCNGQTDEGLPAVTCGVGACQVTIPLCGDDGGVLACTPKPKGVETCNAIDDDCDGVTDNGFDRQSDVNNCGSCGRTCSFPNSTPRCVSGACEVLTCNAGFGNCNGIFPDGCEINLKTDINNCGTCSHLCEAQGADSTCVNGACQFTCQPGFYDINHLRSDGCEYACTFRSATEICNGLDDDCDGVTDNGFNLMSDMTNCGVCGRTCMFANANPRCVSGNCEIFTCHVGYFNCNGSLADGCEINLTNDLNNCGQCNRQCSAAGADSTCTNSTCNYTCRPNFYDLDGIRTNGCEYACTFRSATETCNGRDDNCDGQTDEGFNLQSDLNNCGVCGRRCSFPNSTATCASGTCEVQTCNPGFQNCNGTASDGCEINLTNDVNNCNTCNHQCTANGANSTCVNRACQFTCQAGHIDLDNDPSNGCEYACTVTSATDLPDVNFIDANCDGMDGEINNGVYVAPFGNDAAPGTMMAPKLTILNAAQAAVTLNKRDVYVLAGTYAGPLSLGVAIQGKNIAGGYAAGTQRWTRSSLNTTTIQGGNPALLLDDADNTMVQFFTIRGDNAVGTDSSGHGNSAYASQVKNVTGVTLEMLTLFAGAGAAGSDGANGSNGTPGGNGGLGNRGCENDGSVLCASCAQPVVGTAGTSSCGHPGGVGGIPGRTDNGSGLSGGIGVIATFAGSGSGPNGGTSSTNSIPWSFQQGGNGALGTAGSNGTAAGNIGTLGPLGYVPPTPGAATAGTAGMGGGGGGGGGGGCTPRYFLGEYCYCYTYGSSGGGGGGGGCGGTFGGAGLSGGASVALMLWNSTVSAAQISLNPGRGGNGGKGGTGGSAGSGGLGASSQFSQGDQGYSQVGGKGGNGGAGGVGGHGAGGTGGPSLGVLRNAASSNPIGLGYVPGTAGTGGMSSGVQGPSGVVGPSQQL